MKRATPWVAVLVTLGLLVAGCLGGGGKKEGTGTTSPTGGPHGSNGTSPNVTVTVTMVNYTQSAPAGKPIEVSWEIAAATSGNATMETNHTNVHWAAMSVSNPKGETAYGNATPEQTGKVPGKFNASFTPTIKSGGNASGGNSTATIYLRVHAIIGGSEYWSDEGQVSIGGNSTNVTKTWTIAIKGSGPLASYDPGTLSIASGDSVIWKNTDTLSAHSAKSSSSSPSSFDTGSIASGQSSKPVVLTKAGTYTYNDGTFSATMTAGKITVT